MFKTFQMMFKCILGRSWYNKELWYVGVKIGKMDSEVLK